jgi:uncharacterized membrane protein
MAAWTDQRMEQWIGNLLRTGVLLSAAIVLTGGACYLTRHAHDAPAYRVFRGEPAAYRSVRGVVEAMAPPDCGAVIQLGLLFLIATPIARVAFALAAFALQRDRAHMLISLIVLTVLLYSLIAEH